MESTSCRVSPAPNLNPLYTSPNRCSQTSDVTVAEESVRPYYDVTEININKGRFRNGPSQTRSKLDPSKVRSPLPHKQSSQPCQPRPALPFTHYLNPLPPNYITTNPQSTTYTLCSRVSCSTSYLLNSKMTLPRYMNVLTRWEGNVMAWKAPRLLSLLYEAGRGSSER